jgi:UDPglucose--hexose-1-phosphate uridylyltransferase
MPELRKDPIVGRWVIIATERAKRPHDYHPEERPLPSGVCPFCPGHEAKTPREILAYRPSDGPGAHRDSPGWSVRVFPNRYPALMIEGGLDREAEGLYDKMNGIGAHEVVVETPAHDRSLTDLSDGEIEAVMTAYRDRIVDLKRDLRFRYVMVFKNHRAAAGATVAHSHSQLIALPTVPKNVVDEMEGALAYYKFKERCVFCDTVAQERRDRRRVVYENGSFLVVEPYAPKFPFETWILPRQHRGSFEDCPRAEFAALANALRVALRKLRRALDDPPYNFILHTSPFDQRDNPFYHWHIEIMPTLTRVAGFEWGSGFYINPTPPEEAAAFLRELEE